MLLAAGEGRLFEMETGCAWDILYPAALPANLSQWRKAHRDSADQSRVIISCEIALMLKLQGLHWRLLESSSRRQ
jgi:hypothetical protein